MTKYWITHHRNRRHRWLNFHFSATKYWVHQMQLTAKIITNQLIMSIFQFARHKTRWIYNKLIGKHAQTKHGKHVSVGNLHKKKQNITGWNKDIRSTIAVLRLPARFSTQFRQGEKCGTRHPIICTIRHFVRQFLNVQEFSAPLATYKYKKLNRSLFQWAHECFSLVIVRETSAHCCQVSSWKLEKAL